MPTVADTLCVGLAALREAASTDVADALVRGLGVVQLEGVVRQNVVIAEPVLLSAGTPDRIGTCLN